MRLTIRIALCGPRSALASLWSNLQFTPDVGEFQRVCLNRIRHHALQRRPSFVGEAQARKRLAFETHEATLKEAVAGRWDLRFACICAGPSSLQTEAIGGRG